MRGEVSSSFFVTLGCRQLLGSCRFARPKSESVFVFDCHRLRNREKRRAQRIVRNEEDKTSFSLGRSAESSVVNLLSDQLAQPEGTVNAL